MKLIPIKERLEENRKFNRNPLCREILQQTIDFYKKVGFVRPWIGYFAEENGVLVGAGAFKGQPVNGTLEIAYGTFEKYREQGIGTMICRKLVELSLRSDSSIRITARTLPEKNFSVRILEKNNFIFNATVDDPEDGEVWEWLFKGNK
jgi:[ribosomal protein S5]-alanine N-acetyltransferase